MENTQVQYATLRGTVKPSDNLKATVKPQEKMKGTIYMPEKEEVVKLANAPKGGDVTLSAAAWVSENDKRHSQIVEVKDATNKSQVDLTPDIQQLEVFYEKDVTFVTKNEGGVITAFAIGQKPVNDYTVQVTITELDVPDGTAIWGITVGTPMNPQSIVETGLPTVTEQDEGKVLKAQGGKWIAQEDEAADALSNLEIEKLLKNFT